MTADERLRAQLLGSKVATVVVAEFQVAEAVRSKVLLSL